MIPNWRKPVEVFNVASWFLLGVGVGVAFTVYVFADAMLEMARSVAPISVSAWMD